MIIPEKELLKAAEAVIEIAQHPHRPPSLGTADKMAIARLRTAVARFTKGIVHTPAPLAPRAYAKVSKASPNEA